MNMRFFALLALVLSACSQKSAPSIPLKPGDFYPLKKGDSADYRVRTVRHSELAADTIDNFFLREVIGDTFQNPSGQVSHYVIRYKRTSAQNPWKLDSIWSVRVEFSRVVRTENGLPVQILASPIRLKQVWNINEFNTGKQDWFSYVSIGDTLTVQALDNTQNLLTKKFRQSKYVKNKGLVYLKHVHVGFVDDSNSPDFGKDSIISGVETEIWRLD